MTAQGVYYGLQEPQLIRMRDDALTQLSLARQGKRLNALSGGGKSFGKDLMTVDALKLELIEIRAALQKANPDVHGRRVRRLHADFSRNIL
jgi:hypothetical protein